MYIPAGMRVFGDKDYRGCCDREIVDQINFFSWLEAELPEYRALAIHVKNEGKRSFAQAAIDKKTGSLKAGAPDVVIIGIPVFLMEIKRKDSKKSKWQDGQVKFLQDAEKTGAYTCVAFGFEAAKLAFTEWFCVQSELSIKNKGEQ